MQVEQVKVRKIENSCKQESLENVLTNPNELKQVADDLCKKALSDAKTQLHPLLQQVELERLDQRCEFLQAFKRAMEEEIARKLVIWQPGIQAVYKFDAPLEANRNCWDNTIHLLVMIPRFLNTIKTLGAKLDRNILKQLKCLGWSRFQQSKSVIEVQQVTTMEMRRGLSYGAMFLSLYAAPVKIWPLARDGNRKPDSFLR